MEEQPKPPVPESILLLREIRDGINALVAKSPRAKQQVMNLVGEGLPDIARIWNREKDETLSAVLSMDSGGTRAKACRARWAERPTEAYWVNVIQRLNRSDFCLGRAEGTRAGWKADIDFLCRPDQHAKILEGKYDNKAPVPQGGEKVLLYVHKGEDGNEYPIYGTRAEKNALDARNKPKL